MCRVAKLWFQDYLTNRKQIVKYKQARSKEMLIKNGVLQGSILGPTLFLPYVNDIENCSQLLSFVLFADVLIYFIVANVLRQLMKLFKQKLIKYLNG